MNGNTCYLLVFAVTSGVGMSTPLPSSTSSTTVSSTPPTAEPPSSPGALLSGMCGVHLCGGGVEGTSLFVST